jgi:hypothetical protein
VPIHHTGIGPIKASATIADVTEHFDIVAFAWDTDVPKRPVGVWVYGPKVPHRFALMTMDLLEPVTH